MSFRPFPVRVSLPNWACDDYQEGLRRFEAARSALRRYIAPETRQIELAMISDDLYSLTELLSSPTEYPP
jgi:hypothetical protein